MRAAGRKRGRACGTRAQAGDSMRRVKPLIWRVHSCMLGMPPTAAAASAARGWRLPVRPPDAWMIAADTRLPLSRLSSSAVRPQRSATFSGAQLNSSWLTIRNLLCRAARCSAVRPS